LVFFEGRSRNGRVGHVGIVSDIGRRGQFKFIHASTTNGVIITSSHEPYYQDRYLRGGRIIKDIPKSKVGEKEAHTEQYNYAKAQDSIVYMETADGFVAINSITGKPLEGEPTLSTEQTSKPVKSKKPEDNKKKKSSEVRQAAIRGSEESPIIPPNRITHKVKPGDTLYSISKEHNCSVEQLKKWNPNIVNNVIQAGDELDIYQ
ncbi:MAG: LysM peptidoglycan-binding domain-containing protein, partial [Bacteroidales bacterium]|nr:LysM peptidoglycan-binding domain-containing protein [Bacteroidales bacterium]